MVIDGAQILFDCTVLPVMLSRLYFVGPATEKMRNVIGFKVKKQRTCGNHADGLLTAQYEH